MELVRRILALGPEDPFMLAGTILLAWLSVCALGLMSLKLLAALQDALHRRRKPQPAITVPLQELRPLASRRFMTARRRGSRLITMVRLLVAIGVVLGFTLVVLVTLFAAGGAGITHPAP